ncbi:Uncharacterized protein TPAR_08061 [Tolypocladium paradoxum]|uniref:Uncharacterized protein n=1 Tax=Tolypocladium paradoxum TaxID=94208 RepID=A0A2S4KNG9_9HYPO|nr:Uncharacterized protein TPAR_08061 [Tolypocladium paradoxum]
MDPGADDEAAMAQMMGFSAFGAPQNKKRKYNPNADAATGAPPQPSRGSGRGASTGSNATPLGQAQNRAAGRAATTTDTHEMDLDDDGDSAPAAAHLPAQEDATASSGPALVRPAGLPERPAPRTGFVGSPFSEPLAGQRRHERRPDDDPSRGQWYQGYYDASSNENPWDRLEKAMGLQPKGTWISRGNQPTAAAAT